MLGRVLRGQTTTLRVFPPRCGIGTSRVLRLAEQHLCRGGHRGVYCAFAGAPRAGSGGVTSRTWSDPEGSSHKRPLTGARVRRGRFACHHAPRCRVVGGILLGRSRSSTHEGSHELAHGAHLALPQVPPGDLRRRRRPAAHRAHPAQRRRRGHGRARVPVHGPARHRQDDHRAHPRQGAAVRARSHRRARRHVRAVHRDRRGPPSRRLRARRRVTHRRRQRARGDHRTRLVRAHHAAATRSTSSTRSTCSRPRRSTRCSRRSRSRRRTSCSCCARPTRTRSPRRSSRAASASTSAGCRVEDIADRLRYIAEAEGIRRRAAALSRSWRGTPRAGCATRSPRSSSSRRSPAARSRSTTSRAARRGRRGAAVRGRRAGRPPRRRGRVSLGRRDRRDRHRPGRVRARADRPRARPVRHRRRRRRHRRRRPHRRGPRAARGPGRRVRRTRPARARARPARRARGRDALVERPAALARGRADAHGAPARRDDARGAGRARRGAGAHRAVCRPRRPSRRTCPCRPSADSAASTARRRRPSSRVAPRSPPSRSRESAARRPTSAASPAASAPVAAARSPSAGGLGGAQAGALDRAAVKRDWQAVLVEIKKLKPARVADLRERRGRRRHRWGRTRDRVPRRPGVLAAAGRGAGQPGAAARRLWRPSSAARLRSATSLGAVPFVRCERAGTHTHRSRLPRTSTLLRRPPMRQVKTPTSRCPSTTRLLHGMSEPTAAMHERKPSSRSSTCSCTDSGATIVGEHQQESQGEDEQ